MTQGMKQANELVNRIVERSMHLPSINRVMEIVQSEFPHLTPFEFYEIVSIIMEHAPILQVLQVLHSYGYSKRQRHIQSPTKTKMKLPR